MAAGRSRCARSWKRDDSASAAWDSSAPKTLGSTLAANALACRSSQNFLSRSFSRPKSNRTDCRLQNSVCARTSSRSSKPAACCSSNSEPGNSTNRLRRTTSSPKYALRQKSSASRRKAPSRLGKLSSCCSVRPKKSWQSNRRVLWSTDRSTTARRPWNSGQPTTSRSSAALRSRNSSTPSHVHTATRRNSNSRRFNSTTLPRGVMRTLARVTLADSPSTPAAPGDSRSALLSRPRSLRQPPSREPAALTRDW